MIQHLKDYTLAATLYGIDSIRRKEEEERTATLSLDDNSEDNCSNQPKLLYSRILTLTKTKTTGNKHACESKIEGMRIEYNAD